MALAAYHTSVADAQGNVLSNVTLTVERETLGGGLVPIYSDRDGTAPLGNPVLFASGANIQFYCLGGAYKLTFAAAGQDDVVLRHVGIGLAQESDFGGGDPSIQEVTGASAAIGVTTTTLVVNRSAPAATTLTLPDPSARLGRDLDINDVSGSVTEHVITIEPDDAAHEIEGQASWQIVSTAASRARIKLRPVTDPDDGSNLIWIIVG
jgi:hypothetical protein